MGNTLKTIAGYPGCDEYNRDVQMAMGRKTGGAQIVAEMSTTAGTNYKNDGFKP